jgi:hypothetical protein
MSTEPFPRPRSIGARFEKRRIPLDALAIPARLEDLRSLKAGWLDGQGQAPSQDGLDWLSQAFGQHYPEGLPLPFLYPSLEGGIQAEWSVEPNEASLKVDLVGRSGYWQSLNMETNTEESRELNLADAADWRWLAEKTGQMAGGAA